MPVVTIVKPCGVMTDGAGVKAAAQRIPCTGGLPKVNGGAETLIKWFGLKIICRCFTSTGMRRMLSADAPDVACQRKLSGRWQPARNRHLMVTESQHTNDSFLVAMKHLHQTERIWIGGMLAASMSDGCPPVIALSDADR